MIIFTGLASAIFPAQNTPMRFSTSSTSSTTRLLAFAIIALLVAACAKKDAACESTALFNGKDLAGWVAFAKDNPPGPAATWGVAGGVITCAGMPFGYLRTEKSFSNYRLRVEWRWAGAPSATAPDAKGKPRPRNSGVFLHMQGADEVWPTCVEAQLQENNAGDFIISGPGGIVASELAAARAAALAAAGADDAARKKAAELRRLPKKNPSSEKPAGEWNRYDIICAGGTITVSVNGVEQNRLTGLSVREGRICLQAEGAPVEFRNITLTPLK